MDKQKLISPFDIVTDAADILGKNWKQYFSLSALVAIPSIALGGMALSLGLYDKESVSEYIAQNFSNGNWTTFFGLFILLSLVLMFIQGVVYVATLLVISEKEKDTKQAMQTSLTLLVPVGITAVVSGLIVLGGAILLIIPAVIFGVWFCYATLLTTINGTPAKAALTESKQLVKGRWWQTFGRLIIPAIIFGVGAFIIEMPFALAGKWGSIVGSGVSTMVVSPLSTIALYILYKNAKETTV
jgi:hypothetical protein